MTTLDPTRHDDPGDGEQAPELELFVRRWRRYGKDHLYVTKAGGLGVGRADLVSGDVRIEDHDLAHALHETITAWCRDNGLEWPVEPVDRPVPALQPEPAPEPEPPQPAIELDHLPPPPAPSPPSNLAPPPLLPPPPAPALTSAVPDTLGPEEAPSPIPPPPTWTDLAENRAGAAVQAQADEARRQAPFRTFLARVLRVHTDERAWRIGAEGERVVAHRLHKLDPRWKILHSVPVGDRGSDIDHVLIGPGGVFTVNTKNHPGKKVWVSERALMVDGQRQHYLRNSRHEAKRASKLLTNACGFEIAVQPIIVTVNAELAVKSMPPDVEVVGSKSLRKWLEKRPAVLSDHEIDTIYALARRDTTWR